MKRLFDVFVSVTALVLLCPVILVIGLFIWLKLGRPILFTQVRPGKDGKDFRMIKFRSMLNALDENGIPLSDEDRLTPFGAKLRSSSLDELPGLLNVVKGDMSLVGPRPLLKEYIPLYSPEQSKRHLVRPGITGWAQVNGRNNLSWPKRLELDVWYVENMSFLMDLKILLLTVVKVARREGVSHAESESESRFRGNECD